MNPGFILLLAFLLTALGDAAHVFFEIRSAFQASSATTQPVTSHPAEDHPPSTPPASAPATDELEEHIRLITGRNTLEAREIGARKLLRGGAEAGTRRLVAILEESNDWAAKQAVCQAIAGLPAPPPTILIEPLMALLGTHSEAMDELFVRALHRFDAGSFIPRLKALAGDPLLELARRKAAARALGQTGDKLPAVAALMDLISTDGDGLRATVLDALAVATGVRHADPASALKWWGPRRNMTQLQWLSEVNRRRSNLINLLRAENDDLIRRLVTVYRESYQRATEAQRPQRLLDFLGDESAAIRGLGLDLINTMITDRQEVTDPAKSRLVEMIADPDPVVRRSAALIVGDLRPAGAFERLRDTLNTERDFRVRLAQVVALGGMDDPRAIPVLIGRMEDDSSEVTGAAVSALGMLARRGQAEEKLREELSETLLNRYRSISEDDDLLRQQFLEALARIGSKSARPVFLREMDPRRSVRIRRAAMAGLASFADAQAAEQIRPALKSAGAEIRLSAVQALGRCGQGSEDLDALLPCIDTSQESNPVVREQAWESYLAIASRMPPQAQIQTAASFARPGDRTAQRQRLELLKALQNHPKHYEPLSSKERLELLEGLSDARFELGEYEAAATGLKEIMEMLGDAKALPFESAAARRITALLRANRDEEALSCLGDTAAAILAIDKERDPSGLIEAVLAEVRTRLESAALSEEFSGLIKLYLACETVRASRKMAATQDLSRLLEQITKRRDARIASLLDTLGDNTDVNQKLIAFGPEFVLPQIHARLIGPATTSAPAGKNETSLVEMARTLAPGWSGYVPGCPPQERAAALARLNEIIATPPVSNPTTAPTSAPK